MFDYVNSNPKKYGKPEFDYKKIEIGQSGDVPVNFTTGQYKIVATMGSSNSCEIKVSFGPKDEKNLAPSVREMFVTKNIL